MDKITCNRMVELLIGLSELRICTIIISMRLYNDLDLYRRARRLLYTNIPHTICVDYGYTLDNPNIMARLSIGRKIIDCSLVGAKIIDCYSVKDLEIQIERLLKLKVMV